MRRTVRATGAACALVAFTILSSTAHARQPDSQRQHQQSRLVARSVLPADAAREGSPETGAFLTPQQRTDAAANGVPGPTTGPYFPDQPTQGISGMVPADDRTWWAVSDNGYGTRETSADWQLAIYRLDPRFGQAGGPQVLETILLSDPDRHVPWQTVCDPGHGTPLPPFSFNVLPASRPAACGTDPAARLLTGFDFDPESIAAAEDGTFWIGDEFGPYLLHVDREGSLLAPPYEASGVRAPQNARLDVQHGERPTVAASRGFEGLAISPNGRRLHALLEGAVGDDNPQDVRILTFETRRGRFTGEVRLRMEMPGAKVNLAALRLADGSVAYPGTTAPTGTGGQSVAELSALDGDRFLLLERDGAGDGLPAPRFKKVFVLDASRRAVADGYVDKHPLVDLMAVPDPGRIGGDGDFFRFPFNTIESVHVVNDGTILVANDNNYPFSNGRARSVSVDRTGPLAPDANEIILVGVSPGLHPDRRVLPGS